MAVRVLRFECKLTTEQWKERHPVLLGVADSCQQLVNVLWQEWLCWHRANGSRQKVTEYLDGLAAWREEGGKGDKPKLAVKATDGVPKHPAIQREFPNIHARVLTLMANAWHGKLRNRKAARGNLSGWMAIVLGNESLPSSIHAQPIPFDRQQSRIGRDGDKFTLQVRLIRKGDRVSTPPEEIELYSKAHKLKGQRAILERIAAGTVAFKGSHLMWDHRKRKWFAMICYEPQSTAQPGVDAGKVAVVHASHRVPLKVRCASFGRDLWPLSMGRNVPAVRSEVTSQRWNRQANYRIAGSSTKGHGRERAMDGVLRLGRRWRDFVKRMNHVASSKIVEECQVKGVGGVVYFQPSGERAERCYLASSGRHRNSSLGWDWHQLAAMLAYKCQSAGIELEVRKNSRAK